MFESDEEAIAYLRAVQGEQEQEFEPAWLPDLIDEVVQDFKESNGVS